ncbi:hypothetical protein GCM10010405_22470 [Streptomyces macrosporus]|uniref:Uncharacterized protein n=1 Tax=Streptomyces macrosporus TaxID=44032 RepID=A0ABN3JS10_9ACTN
MTCQSSRTSREEVSTAITMAAQIPSVVKKSALRTPLIPGGGVSGLAGSCSRREKIRSVRTPSRLQAVTGGIAPGTGFVMPM